MHRGVELAGITVAACICLEFALAWRSSESRKPVVGKWVFDSANSVFPDPKVATLVNQTGPQIVYGFKSNGSFTEEPGEVGGSFRLDGRRVFLRIQSVDGIEIHGSQESGLIFLSDDGRRISIYSREVPPEIIALKRAG